MMHYQTRNPFRERDHRISLMPMARPGKDHGTGFDHLPIWDEQPKIGRIAGLLIGLFIILTMVAVVLP